MKNKILWGIMIIFLSLTLTGCGNTLTKSSETLNNEVAPEAKLVAKNAVYNKMQIYELFEDDPESDIYKYFTNIPLENEAGDKIGFNSLSKEEKQAFLAAWQKNKIEELTEAYHNDKYSLERAKVKNKSVAIILRATQASAVSTAPSYKVFKENLVEEYQKSLANFKVNYPKDTNDQAAIQSNQSRIEAISSSFLVGRLMYRPPVGGWGHIAIMAGGETGSLYWDPNWEKDSTTPIAIGAWNYAAWADDLDMASKGVIYEPLALWKNIQNFKILGLQKVYWKYKIRRRRIIFYKKYVYASLSDYKKAAKYARSKIGEPYDEEFEFDADDDKHTCSSLVRDSWESVSSRYDLESWDAEFSPVSPEDIYDSPSTYLIKTVD